MGAREKFFKTYANLPEPERTQVIVIVDNKPYSWNAAYNEIDHHTQLGNKILIKLEELGIL